MSTTSLLKTGEDAKTLTFRKLWSLLAIEANRDLDLQAKVDLSIAQSF